MKELLRYHRKGPKAEPVAMVCTALSLSPHPHICSLFVRPFVCLFGWSMVSESCLACCIPVPWTPCACSAADPELTVVGARKGDFTLHQAGASHSYTCAQGAPACLACFACFACLPACLSVCLSANFCGSVHRVLLVSSVSIACACENPFPCTQRPPAC